MTAKPIRIIQVGLGKWGRDWATRIIRTVRDVQVAAYVDTSQQALAEICNTEVADREACYQSLQAALRDVQADAVLVTTELATHVPIIKSALSAGKHVLTEKPFAPSLSEASEIASLAERKSLTVMVSQNYRFYPAPRAAQQLVADQTLGRALHIDIDFRRFSTPLSAPLGHRLWAQPLLLDMAIHHFDLLRAVLGTEPLSVYATTWNAEWAGYRDPPEAAALITFADGTTVSYRGSWISPRSPTLWAGEWRMEFERGEVWWTSRGDQSSGSHDELWTYDHYAQGQQVQLPALEYIDRAGALDAFVRALRANTTPESSADENLGSLKLAYAVIESALARRSVDLETDNNPCRCLTPTPKRTDDSGRSEPIQPH